MDTTSFLLFGKGELFVDAVVKSVAAGSIGEEIGLAEGDRITAVNGDPLLDILDYRFATAAEEFELEILKKDGETEIVDIINEDFEELGITFENFLMDRERWCRNKCIFCFVDQLPKKMRKTLYYKDDDYRLSALMGNYITLTNLSEEDTKRIIDMHLPRINISVHTVDRDLRGKMLGNKNADVMPFIKRFAKARIFMDCQAVLCPGINDGEKLDETVNALAEYFPYVQCLCVVPVGLTGHREGLCNLRRYTKDEAEAVIRQTESYAEKFKKKLGTNFIFASDEFYVIAGHDLPDYEHYEEFLQLENGVGLLTSLIYEFESAKTIPVKTKKTVATGVSAAPYIRSLVNSVTDKIDVIPIINKFLGESITVAGLISAQDIITQLKGKDLGEALLLPSVMLNYDGLFLDGLTVSDVERELGIKVITVPNDGAELKKAIAD